MPYHPTLTSSVIFHVHIGLLFNVLQSRVKQYMISADTATILGYDGPASKTVDQLSTIIESASLVWRTLQHF